MSSRRAVGNKSRSFETSIRVSGLWAACLSSVLAIACAAAPPPPALSEADAVSRSAAVEQARRLAPQATAAADKIYAEAQRLQREGQPEAAEVTSEQAVAAYEEAFALARAAEAKERLEKAEERLEQARTRLVELDARQARVARDADAYEMRARVALDKEEVKDVDSMTPERARARRRAAVQLASEAKLLCVSARLLDPKAEHLSEAQKHVEELQSHLDQGSVRDDLFPRAAEGRSRCLKALTMIRRPKILQNPAASDSDRLLEALTETGKLFAFRDDRGVVVNLASPFVQGTELKEEVSEIVQLLGGTAKKHDAFPLLVVVHTARRGDEKLARQRGEAFADALRNGGAPEVTVDVAGDAQPVVDGRVSGAAERNSRVEVVFVVPGR